MRRADLAKRGAVAAVVALLVVAAAVALAPSPGTRVPGDGGLNLTEYDESRELTTYDQQGAVRADAPAGEGGTVVVDTTHSNRVDESDLQPLVRELLRLNYTVEFSDESNLTKALDGAVALIVVDPGRGYSAEETDRIRNFTESGGRLLVLAEPDRRSLLRGPFTIQLTTVESELGQLGRAYNVTVDSRYLYNQRVNDGNYRHVVGRPAGGIGAESLTFYTAAALHSHSAEPVVVAARGTRMARTDAPGDYALAVRQEGAMFVGDTDFVTPDRNAVADNEAFVAHLVRFLAEGEPYEPVTGGEEPTDEDGTTESDSDAGGEEGTEEGGGEEGTATPPA